MLAFVQAQYPTLSRFCFGGFLHEHDKTMLLLSVTNSTQRSSSIFVFKAYARNKGSLLGRTAMLCLYEIKSTSESFLKHALSFIIKYQTQGIFLLDNKIHSQTSFASKKSWQFSLAFPLLEKMNKQLNKPTNYFKDSFIHSYKLSHNWGRPSLCSHYLHPHRFHTIPYLLQVSIILRNIFTLNY